MADGRRGHDHAAPAAAGAVQHGPHQAGGAALAGGAPDALAPPAGLAEGALDEVGVTDTRPVPGREAQVGGQALGVRHKALDRGGEPRGVGRGELVGATAGVGDGSLPGRCVDVVEDPPEGGLDLGLVLDGHLGQQVARPVDQAPLVQAVRARPRRAGRGRRQTPPAAALAGRGRPCPPRNPAQASVDSEAPGSKPTSTGRPSVVMPHAASTGSARAPSCILKWLPSRNRYSRWTSARSRRFQVSNSSLIASHTRLTVDFDSAASAPSASARLASTSRTARPRTKPAMTRHSRALVRHTPTPSSRDAKASSLPRSFGRSPFTLSPDRPLLRVAIVLPGRELSTWSARSPRGSSKGTSASGCTTRGRRKRPA